MSTEQQNIAHTFVFDSQQIDSLANQVIINQGLADFKDNRVMSYALEGECLAAEVESVENEEVLHISLSFDQTKQLKTDCDCGLSEEHCRHSIALLLAWSHFQATDDNLLGAVDSAIADRIKRGRTEVKVEALTGEPWFGIWRAESMGGHQRFKRSYQVHIRSLHRRANFCTCPDFATNELETCKHIESVLHQVSKHVNYTDF